MNAVNTTIVSTAPDPLIRLEIAMLASAGSMKVGVTIIPHSSPESSQRRSTKNRNRDRPRAAGDAPWGGLAQMSAGKLQKNLPGHGGRAGGLNGCSGGVIHVELDRMGGHPEARDLLHLELDIAIDQVVGEHVSGLEEVAILVQGVQRLVQRMAD